MKILFWTDGFAPRLGGIETQSLKFIKAMQKRGHEYKVIAQQDHSSWKEAEIYEDIPIRRFDFNGVLKKQDLKTIVSVEGYISRVMKEFQPDIIHLNASVGGSVFVFLLMVKLFKVPIILTAYSPYLLEGKFSAIIKKVASKVDRICCISNWVLKEMQEHLSLEKNKLQLVYCGLSIPEVTPLPLSFSPPILLVFGRLSKEKGFDVAIQAFSLLKKQGSPSRMLIAGGGIQRAELEKLVVDLGLSSSVTFTGVLTDEEALSTFNQATIVIVPSIIESFGLVILEAMQMQRPVIASRVEGIPEVVVDGETGILVRMRDPQALCQAIQELLVARAHEERDVASRQC
jgi:glycogen(starch) synthase